MEIFWHRIRLKCCTAVPCYHHVQCVLSIAFQRSNKTTEHNENSELAKPFFPTMANDEMEKFNFVSKTELAKWISFLWRKCEICEIYNNFSIFHCFFLCYSLVFDNNCLTEWSTNEHCRRTQLVTFPRSRRDEKHVQHPLFIPSLRIDKHCISSTWSLFIMCVTHSECDKSFSFHFNPTFIHLESRAMRKSWNIKFALDGRRNDDEARNRFPRMISE